MNQSNGKGSMSTASSSTTWKANDVVPDQFPAGLRVLVVDDDPTCLVILEKMLRTCLYEGIFSLVSLFCFYSNYSSLPLFLLFFNRFSLFVLFNIFDFIVLLGNSIVLLRFFFFFLLFFFLAWNWKSW